MRVSKLVENPIGFAGTQVVSMAFTIWAILGCYENRGMMTVFKGALARLGFLFSLTAVNSLVTTGAFLWSKLVG